MDFDYSSSAFIVYELMNESNDLFMLSKLCDEKSLDNIINFFDGAKIKFPSKEEYFDSKILARYIYLLEIKKISFNDSTKMIESELNIAIPDTMFWNKKINDLKKKIDYNVEKLFDEKKEREI